MSSTQDTISSLLDAAKQGDAEAQNVLFSKVYDELRRLARVVRQGRAGETINTTALVHEAYFRLHPAKDLAVNDRAHFFRLVARAMRQVLCDFARRKNAEKRGGGQWAITFDETKHAGRVSTLDVLSLDEALKRLEALNARQAQVVECRFFAGLTIDETAGALGISVPTVVRDWRFAQAWLAKEMMRTE